MALVLSPLANIPLIRQGDNLADILISGLHKTGITLQDGDILVIAQKIVSKAEGRTIKLTDVRPRRKAIELAAQSGKDPRVVELVLQESNAVLRIRPGTLIVEHKLGFVCANAGIDHSNVGDDIEPHAECVLLLPENPDRSAQAIRARLEQGSGTRLGVLIIDSHGRAWRNGTAGIAIGISGLPGLVDLRGRPDLFGRRLQITQVAAADELAAAASLVMGEAAEGTPAIHVRGFPYELRESALNEILRPRHEDLFR